MNERVQAVSYLVLARKYRPQKFSELIGQEHITRLLESAIVTNRVAHAFLFSGPRGIGKTSCARILAKSLNCQQARLAEQARQAPTTSPCGECASCREIAQSISFDVLEIDGASNRGIDEIRLLRENVKFAPSHGRYKIYIVDEVHMLTLEAFNALLKTLEEPPEHVKFIFATTNPHKVPSTIISRCQRFDFKRIPVKTIMGALEEISQKENFQIDEEAVFAVAKAASGSLRDALSILDQLSAISERTIKVTDVSSMLGLVETELTFELVDSIAKKDCRAALVVFDKIIEQGKDLKQLERDLIEHFRNLMIMKIGGKSLGRLVDCPVAIKEMLLNQSGKFSLEEILKAIELIIEAQEVSRIMESGRFPLEMALAKLTYSPSSLEEVNSVPEEKEPQPMIINPSVPPGPVHRDGEEASNRQEDLDLEKIKRSWSALTYAVSREKMSVATFLQEGSPFELKGSRLTIAFSKEAGFQKEALEHKENLQLLEKVFSEKLQGKVSIELKVIENYKPEDEEPIVKSALKTFKGKVVNKWHQ